MKSKNFLEINKSLNEHNPVTIADFTIQRSIEYILNKKFPGLKMVGEEDPSKYSLIDPTLKEH